MKCLVAAPFIPIASKLHSHRGAQGVIYADQLARAGKDVTANMPGPRYVDDFNAFDELYVYHGNDWANKINLFGGLKAFPYTYNFINFTKFKKKVYSLVVDFPNLAEMLEARVKNSIAEGKEVEELWKEADWDNLRRMHAEATTINPNDLVKYDKISIGDSHAICMYRPGWSNISIPYRTLYGALKLGLHTFVPDGKYTEIEFYFGNIDVRHHLCRQEHPEAAARAVAREYIKQAREISDKYGARVQLYELLPIENESRPIPKSGWYKDTPFYGSWKDRVRVRAAFIDELAKTDLLYRWTDGFLNEAGELDFKYMEKPQSVHLSREYYPHWQGLEWNHIKKSNSLEAFL